MKQQRRPTESAGIDASPAESALPLPALRLEQFLDLERGLLAVDGDPETVAGRIVQGVTLFLGAAGAAVGIVQDGVYRLLADYGLAPEYRARHHGVFARESPIARALASGSPMVVPEPAEGATALRTVVFPFPALEITGALHVVLAADATLPAPDLELARALAFLSGAAVANAQQRQRLTRVARLKGDALTAMAHDLRAPLNALVGYASLLGDGAFGALTTEQRDVAASLERQALELIDLLGATLDVARLETGTLPIRSETFALGDLLTTLRAGTFARANREQRLVVTLPPDLPALHTDRVKVKEIVQNLVDNALRHSAGARVEIEVGLAPDRETVRITVRDTGPGIAADVLPRLFEPFRPHGTGFGLYIVRSFAEALGGRVAAHSRPGEGTAVTVELPLRAPVRPPRS